LGIGQKKVETWGDKKASVPNGSWSVTFPLAFLYKAITENLSKDILACLRRIEDKGAIETTHRTLQITGEVFLCEATGRIVRDGHYL
jgi:hypothetical protein